jgi:periplasmic protein TonB
MNENQNIRRSFLLSGCLSETGLSDFLHQNLTQAELEQTSEHLRQCELCRFAVQGIDSNMDVVEINRMLHRQIDVLLDNRLSEPNHTTRPETKAETKPMLRYFKRFRNIAAVIPLAFLLGSVLWLTAALQIMDHRISGIHNPISDPAIRAEVPKEIREFETQSETLSPPVPKIAEFMVVHEEIVLDEEINIEADEEFVIEHQFTVPFVEEKMAEEKEVFIVVEEPPRFPGGHDAMLRFLAENIYYPQPARQEAIQGTVYLTFLINTDGSVDNASVLRGVHWSLDEEALRVIRAMPEWIPGKQRGKHVNVQFTMPIRFALE